MQFKVKQRKNPNIPRYPTDDYHLAQKFSELLKKELGGFVKSIILFGSAARAAEHKEKTEKGLHEHDIDILVIVNDLTMVMSPEVVEAYRVITENTAAKVSKRLHITTMKLTSFWEYVRNGDPVAINMLRDGVPLQDVGIFEPLQMLLFQGRIRPTKESVWNYYARAPATLANANWHVLQATIDLYWAVVDAAHAALMKMGEVPPSPAHVADLIQARLVKPGYVAKKYADTMRFFYNLSKKITHREIRDIPGKTFDQYVALARDFINAMKRVIEGK
ncbi:MAG: nucleotidyltransferase domain-containing protein [Candidatus Woesearchaeota archaeon]